MNEEEQWEDIEIELLGVVGAIQSDELIQRFSKSVLKAREAYLNARREGVEAAIEAILSKQHPIDGHIAVCVADILELKSKLLNN